MQSRTIGEIEVSPLGLGTSRMASLGAGRSRSDAARLLDAAADIGVTFIDTADTYGSTACERWLGDVMQGRSEHFVVATKCGLPTADLPGVLRPLNQPVKKIMQLGGQEHYLSPTHVCHSIEASLRRLRRERIEIYFLHSPPPGIEDRDDLFTLLDEARMAGKIGMYGISSPDPAIIDAVTRARHCRVAQTTVNPLSTPSLLPLARRALAAEPTELVANHVAMGLLSPSGPSVDTPWAVADLRRKLELVSAERGVSKAQLLLRHAAAVPQVRVVLSGTSNPAHLIENAAALEAPPVPEDLLT